MTNIADAPSRRHGNQWRPADTVERRILRRGVNAHVLRRTLQTAGYSRTVAANVTAWIQDVAADCDDRLPTMRSRYRRVLEAVEGELEVPSDDELVAAASGQSPIILVTSSR